MVVDSDGVMLTAHQDALLVQNHADTPATDPTLKHGLRLRASQMPDLLLDQPSGERVRTRVFSDQVEGIAACREADAWTRTVLGREDVRLIWWDEPTRRSLDPKPLPPRGLHGIC